MKSLFATIAGLAFFGTAVTAGLISGLNGTTGVSPRCDKLHLLLLRGTGSPFGLMASRPTPQKVIEVEPESVLMEVPYPAKPVPDYFKSDLDGVVMLANTIFAIVDHCHDAKIALFGFSQVCSGCLSALMPLPSPLLQANIGIQGAQVIADLLCGTHDYSKSWDGSHFIPTTPLPDEFSNNSK